MKRQLAITIQISALALITCLSLSLPAAQNPAPPSLDEQLKAQYQLAKTGSDSGGLTVVQPGTVLTVQKGGIVGFPSANAVRCPSIYKDGNLKGPGSFCVAMVGGKEKTRFLQVGEKVYLTKIDVNAGKDRILLSLIECDSCNGVNETSSYKSDVGFQFQKSYLATANASQVEDIIGQVLTIDEGGDQAQQQTQGAQPQQPAAEQSQASPQSVQLLGQTVEQVTAMFGQPQQIVNAGPKQLYIYKDLRVSFINGKVTDVQ